MAFDAVIKNYSGNEEQIYDAIINSLFISKIKSGMPVMVGIVGKSSSGKSVFCLGLQERLYKQRGINFLPYVEHCTLLRPNDYAPKMDAILNDKKLKKVFTVQLDEAKFLIASDDWQQFKNKATRTITATCRSIKPLIFFIVAQRRSDIEARTRQALDYFIDIVRRPGTKPIAKIYEVYEDKRYYNAPEFKTRAIIVNIQNDKGESTSIIPKIKFSMPSKEVWDKYKSFETPTKNQEINKLLTRMKEEVAKLSGSSDKKVQEFVKYLLENPNELEKFGKQSKTGWKLDSKLVSRMGYTVRKQNEIERLLSESLNKFEKTEKEVKE